MENKVNYGNEIKFCTENGEEVSFFVLEQTTLNGINYLLVTDQAENDGEAYILKDISEPSDPEAVYDIVEEDEELSLIAGIFEELLDDVELM